MIARVRAAVAVACLAAGAVAHAQVLVPLDPAVYPMLASLSTWLRSGASDAKNCSATAAMTLSARSALEKVRSDSAAIDELADALGKANKGALTAAQARALATSYVRMAQPFLVLTPEAQGLAVAQLCRSAVERGDKPFANAALLKRIATEAQRCSASGFSDAASSYLPLECVVRTVARRP